MLTVTMNVSCTTFIFLLRLPSGLSLFAHDVAVEHDAAVDPLLVDALHLVVEAGEPVERLLEGVEILQHRPRALVPALARHDDADTRRVDQRQRRRDAALARVERQVIDLVADERAVRPAAASPVQGSFPPGSTGATAP